MTQRNRPGTASTGRRADWRAGPSMDVLRGFVRASIGDAGKTSITILTLDASSPGCSDTKPLVKHRRVHRSQLLDYR